MAVPEDNAPQWSPYFNPAPTGASIAQSGVWEGEIPSGHVTYAPRWERPKKSIWGTYMAYILILLSKVGLVRLEKRDGK